jgi:ribosomal protein S18 acetylase RimI-like enzyme
VAQIRPCAPGDLDALYAICLQTGDHGADATAQYRDPRIIGEIYAAPYATLEPALAFVAEDADGVAGYILGTADTRAFEARCEAEWWPRLRTVHPNPRGTPPGDWTWDQKRAFQIHRPFPIPDPVVAAAPAHLHINLLPRLQGQGMGKAMLDTWLWAAGGRAHLGCDVENLRAQRFYDAYGFSRLDVGGGSASTIWMTFGASKGG